MGRPANRLRDVENYFIPEPNSGCWIWLGEIVTGGYGRFQYCDEGSRYQLYAHRAVWEFYRGRIPEKLTLDHLCRNRWCVNPQHCEPVTLRENILRGIGPAAINSRRTECKHGHPLNGENLVHFRNGKARRCKICNINGAKEFRAKRRRLYESALSKAL